MECQQHTLALANHAKKVPIPNLFHPLWGVLTGPECAVRHDATGY